MMIQFRNLLMSAALLASAAWSSTASAAPPAMASPAVSIHVSGAPEMVFQWSARACPPTTIPDAPARAFRDAEGNVRLIATSFDNWSLYGSDLNKVKPDCQSLFRGAGQHDPLAFDDHAWIEGTYTFDGHTVYALLSNEWDAFRHGSSGVPIRDECRARQFLPGCMVYSINVAVSSDGGRHFRYQLTGRQHVVAGSAMQLDKPTRNGSAGPKEPAAPAGSPTASNIIGRNGYFYAMVYVRGASLADDGNCLFRTDDLADASHWRAWDGQDFTLRPVDAGPGLSPPQQCPRVAPGVLRWDVRSLAWHAATSSYIAIMHAASSDGSGHRIVGVYYATSPDLTHWSETRLLVEAPSTLDRTCRPPAHYPAMLDPTSTSRNFETVGRTAFIYYTQFNVKNCQISLDRDLLRLPITIDPAH